MDLTFETSELYNILVGEALWPIAKSLPKTLELKSTIFEHRIAFLRQNHLHERLTKRFYAWHRQSRLVTRAQLHT